MGLKLAGLAYKGNEKDEQVVLEVTADGNLADHVIADQTFKGGMASNKFRHTFWFPDWPVKRGDKVVLRTGTGKAHTYTNPENKQVWHRFYWNVGVGVWNDSGDTVYLLEVRDSVAASTWIK